MFAEKIMVTKLVTAKENEPIADVIVRMHKHKLRMLPVLNEKQQVTGVISTFCVLSHIVPDYLISGDLNEISFAPDMGILRREYVKSSSKQVSEVMSTSPLFVKPNDSIISVSANLAGHGRHEYALVVDDEKHLLGVISSGDILDALEEHASEVNDA